VSTLIVRDFPDEAHAALKVQAASKGGRRSVEGYARTILIEAVSQRSMPGLGDRLAAIGRKLQADLEAAGEKPFTNEEIDALFKRSDEQGEPASFE
jgi:plasmid stability protein